MKVFISYSRRDSAIADRLVADLEGRSFEVVIDRRDLPYGEEWQDQLGRMIREADTIIWLVSPTSVRSRWCNWELGEVQRINKRLIPVRIGPVAPDELPEALGRIHVLPAEDVYDPTRHLDVLVAALETDRAWIEAHTRYADRAADWVRSGRRPERLLRGRALSEAEAWRDRRAVNAPALGSDTLDLLLQSRRATTRSLRRLVGLAAGVAVALAGLAVVAVWQTQVARRNVEVAAYELANTQVSLAAELTRTGAIDEALLLLSDASTALSTNPPTQLLIALNNAIALAEGRTVISIPKGSLAFVARDGLYLEDPASMDIWLYAGADPLSRVYQGLSSDSNLVALDTVSAQLVVVRESLSVELIADGTKFRLGQFDADLDDEEVDNAITRWSITEDGLIIPRGFGVIRGEVFDVTSRSLLKAPNIDADLAYYKTPAGQAYLVPQLASEAGPHRAFRMDREGSAKPWFTEIAIPHDVALQAFASECLRRGDSHPDPTLSLNLASVIDAYPGAEQTCALVPKFQEEYLVTSLMSSGVAGITRNDTLIEPAERLNDYPLSDYLGTSGVGYLTWSGVSRFDGVLGAVDSNGVYLDGDEVEFSRREPEAPSIAMFMADHRVALVEPQSGRLVVYDYKLDAFRPTLRAPVSSDAPLPLNWDSCYPPQGHFELTDGTQIDFSEPAVGESEARKTLLTITRSAGVRSLEIPETHCLQFTRDFQRALVEDWSSDTPARLVDFAKVLAGGRIEDAVIAELPVSFFSVRLVTKTGDIAAVDGQSAIVLLHWNPDTSQWSQSTLYQGSLVIDEFEPNSDASALLINEHQIATNARAFLYSTAARQEWLDFGRNINGTMPVHFADNDDVFGDTLDGDIIIRLPSLDMLVDEARRAISKPCAPNGDDLRSSPCWPEWRQ